MGPQKTSMSPMLVLQQSYHLQNRYLQSVTVCQTQKCLFWLFAVKNSIPISTVQKLVEFRKFLMKDAKPLEGVKMRRTLTTYKLKDSLATNNHIKLVEKLKQYVYLAWIRTTTHPGITKRGSQFLSASTMKRSNALLWSFTTLSSALL